jgi:hypothetical protein
MMWLKSLAKNKRSSLSVPGFGDEKKSFFLNLDGLFKLQLPLSWNVQRREQVRDLGPML